LAAARHRDDPVTEARALNSLARALARLDHFDEAMAALGEAHALQRKLGDKEGEIHVLMAYATVFESRQRHAEAFEYACNAWQLAEHSGNPLWYADVLTVMGRQAAWLGHRDEALSMCERALELYQELGHPEGEADAQATLGYIQHCRQQYGLAIACYERSLELDRELGDQFWEATMLEALGDAYEATGEHGRAASTWRAALDIIEALRLPGADAVRAKLGTLSRTE